MTSKAKTKSKLLILSAFLLVGGALGSTSCGRFSESMFITVKGKDLEVTFCDRAASIFSIKYKGKYMTYHPKNENTFLKSGYCYGRTLGRITGRIKDGKLKVGDKDYQLEMNEVTATKNNSIHGGFNGLPSKDFTRHVSETDKATSVSFNYVSPHMEAGYPETLNTWVTYIVYKNEPKIDTHITATSTGKTPVNITTHPFFRLADEGDIKDCVLKIPTTEMAKFEFNSEGKTSQVVLGTQEVTDPAVSKGDVHPFDFHEGKKIGQDIKVAKELDTVSGGYDHIWKFNENDRYINLYNPSSKVNLHVTTDADAIIMYANCYPHENDEMNPSGKDTLYSGISVEPYKFFTKDSVDDLMIEPNKPFTRNISYNFSIEQ